MGSVAGVIHTDTGCSERSTRLSVILGSHRKLHEAFVRACGKSVTARNTFQLPPDLLLMQQNCQRSPFSFTLFSGFFPDQTRCGKHVYSSVLPQDCYCFLWLSSASVSFLATLDTFFYCTVTQKLRFFFLFISIIQVSSC